MMRTFIAEMNDYARFIVYSSRKERKKIKRQENGILRIFLLFIYVIYEYLLMLYYDVV